MTMVMAFAPSGTNGGFTSCTTVTAFCQLTSYFFDIGHSSLVVFSGSGYVGQRDSQPFAATGCSRHHGSVRDVQDRGGFCVGVSLDVCVVHHCPEDLAQGVNRC